MLACKDANFSHCYNLHVCSDELSPMWPITASGGHPVTKSSPPAVKRCGHGHSLQPKHTNLKPVLSHAAQEALPQSRLNLYERTKCKGR